MQAANAAAFLNLQRQQAVLNGKNIAPFYPTPIVSLAGTALPTSIATHLQLNGGFAGALPYQFSFPGPQYGTCLKLDTNNNNGLVDFSAAAAAAAASMGATPHHKAPFALIHS